MGYRKFKAGYIYTDDHILPPDTVLITDESGVILDRVSAADAGEGIETFEGMLTPGFVNSHCHLELSHMKGRMEPGTGLVQFLTRVIKERQSDRQQIYEAMRLAEIELRESGTVALGDICNTTDSLHIKQHSTLLYKNFIEVMGFRDEQAEERLAAARETAEAFEQASADSHHRKQTDMRVAGSRALLPFSKPSLTPHAPYSVSFSLFQLINSRSAGQVVSLHNQETKAENQFYANGTGGLLALYKNLGIDAGSFKASGRSSLQTVLPWLNRVSGIMLVHNTYTEPGDILFAKEQIDPALFFCVCINANRYIESANPPLDLLRENNCLITIGTDSYASNRQLNMLEEIKTIHEQFPHISLPELLQWATTNGARALGMSEQVGSFDRGKQPGIVLIDNIRDHHVTADSGARRIL